MIDVTLHRPALTDADLTGLLADGHSEGVESGAWSPDGARLASASYDNTVRVWHVPHLVPGYAGGLVKMLEGVLRDRDAAWLVMAVAFGSELASYFRRGCEREREREPERKRKAAPRRSGRLSAKRRPGGARE